MQKRSLHNQKTCDPETAVCPWYKIWIRIPVIPGVNDSAQDMQQLRDFLQSAGKPDKNKLLALEELFG